jgi:WD40 repeat protein/DNA-binding SARP family transcriptional activator
MMQFHALGGLTITNDGEEVALAGSRQRRLVAMLLIHRNSVVSVDRLAEAVFAGEPTPAASTTLRSYVARLRRVVDGNGSGVALATQAPGYVLRVPGEAFDVTRFESLLADGRARLTRDDAAGSASVLREALLLSRGEPYGEFADEEWARPEAQRLGELRLVACEHLIDADLACGRAADVIPEVEALVAAHPLRESFRMQLMLALYRAGRQVDALRVVRDYRAELVEELGLDPSPELIELERRILNHDQSLVLPEPTGLPLRGYRLRERLGTGRNGTVYAARLPGVGREFAIRVVREELADDPEFVRSFEASTHRVASLRHPAIVPIYDYWREPGAAYVVMRRMTGGTLRDRLQRGAVTNADVEIFVRRIGAALVVAADGGIVHGRLIPESVLYDEAGEPHLADFVALDVTGRHPGTGDDVCDFATLVEECLTIGGRTVPEALADALAAARSTAARPSMSELVGQLIGALSAADAPAATAVRNPYKGLRAFEEPDVGDFFGRDELVEQLHLRLSGSGLRSRFILVVGGSGTGKSSVVRAGLLPRVRRGDVHGSRQWFVTTMLPGGSPFKELAESLRHVAVAEVIGLADELAEIGGIDRVLRRLLPEDGQLLLVVDQFEELFTMATEADQRAFLDGLIHAVSAPDSRLRLVATLRADFYDRPLAFQRFGEAVNDATVTIAAMSPAQLEAAIARPAERAGRHVEPALVAELVGAVVDEPAALPSLQFSLFELADRTDDRCLTLAAYRELGGIDGAIASRAEALYGTLDDDERAAVRQMFERLVVVGAEGEPTRRRTPRAELSGALANDTVEAQIDRWAAARLLTLDRNPQTRLPTVEVAHEALLREWPRLRRWLDEDRDVIVLRGNLREAAASWDDLGREPGALYRGTRLEAAVAVTAATDDLPALERAFLDASREQLDNEERQAADAARRQARANRRLRIQLVALATALVVALVGGFIAVDQRRDAQRERRTATARELAAAADASLDRDPERSMLLALAAIDETRTSDGTVLPEAEEALHSAVTASRLVLSVPDVGGELDWSPAGEIFVTEGPEDTGVVDIRDADTGESVRSWHGHDVDVNDVEFSSDGSMLATTGDDATVRVWDPDTGEQLWEFTIAGGGAVWGPSFSPDGSRLAASWPDLRLVRVFDLATGELETQILVSNVSNTAFSPDGERLALSSPLVTVVDVGTGEVLFRSGDDWIYAVAWSPDGRWLATASPVEKADIWDAESWELASTLRGHTGLVMRLDWNPDSRRVATASEDGTTRVWEVAPGGARQLLSVSSQRGLGAGVEFSPDGDRLMTSDGFIGAVNVWDVSPAGRGEWRNLPGIPAWPISRVAAFMRDGSLAVSEGGAVTTWDVRTGDRQATYGTTSSGDYFAFVEPSPDGELLAAAGTSAVVWDVSTRARRFVVPGGGERSTADVAWSRDSQRLALLQYDGDESSVVIVDRSGKELATIRDEPGFTITAVSFSPDGRTLATARTPSERADHSRTTVRIWDWERGEVVSSIDTPAVMVVFDPTRPRVVVDQANSSNVEVWDTAAGDRVAMLAAPIGAVPALTVSPDGSLVATAGGDGTVRLWDPETGVQQLVLPAGQSQPATVSFSPDGSMLASADRAGVVRVWALDLDDLTAIAHERLTRGFTDDECRDFLHLERCPRTA